jgi:hypothetical protein
VNLHETPVNTQLMVGPALCRLQDYADLGAKALSHKASLDS